MVCVQRQMRPPASEIRIWRTRGIVDRTRVGEQTTAAWQQGQLSRASNGSCSDVLPRVSPGLAYLEETPNDRLRCTVLAGEVRPRRGLTASAGNQGPEERAEADREESPRLGGGKRGSIKPRPGQQSLLPRRVRRRWNSWGARRHKSYGNGKPDSRTGKPFGSCKG